MGVPRLGRSPPIGIHTTNLVPSKGRAGLESGRLYGGFPTLADKEMQLETQVQSQFHTIVGSFPEGGDTPDGAARAPG